MPLRWRRRVAVDRRHDLLRHQLHRAPPEPLVRPIVAGIEERAEIADLLAEGEQIVDDLVGSAPDHDLIDDRLRRDRRIGGALVGLEEVRPAAPHELRRERPVVAVIGTFRRGGVALRRGEVVGDEDALGDPPVLRLGRPAGLLAALDVFRPVALHPFGQEEVRRDRLPAARSSLGHALGEGRDGGDDDRRMRTLKRFRHEALAELGDQRALGGDGPMLALQIVGRLAGPDGENMIDRLDEHRGAVLVEVAENLGVGQEAAGTDAEDEAAVRHVVDHRHLAGDAGRMVVRHVDGAAAEPDLLRLVQEPRHEDQGRRDRLGGVGHMLADEPFDEAELVREDGHLAVFLQRLAELPPDRMDRHCEEAELHLRSSPELCAFRRAGAAAPAAERGARARNTRRG